MEIDDRAPARGWLARRWVRVGLVGLVVLMAGAILAQAVKRPGVYWSDANVRFVGPSNPLRPNSLQVSERSLVMTAGTVDQMIDDRNGPVPADPTATLVGLGVRNGWSVTLPNRGGQYQNSFVDPYLDVQVVGATRAQVNKTMARLINRIMAALTSLQEAEHVAPADRITAKVLPEPVPPVYYEHGSRIRALGASVAILISIAALAAAALWRLARWRPRTRTGGATPGRGSRARPEPEAQPNRPRPLAMRG